MSNGAGQESAYYFIQHKRSVLFSRVTLFSGVLGIVHAIQDSFSGEMLMPIINSFFTLFVFGCYWANKKGYYHQSVLVFILFFNIAFFLYASVLPKEDGVYLFYFPLIVLSSVLHGKDYKGRRNFFAGLSSLLLVLLFLSDFNFFGWQTLHPTNLQSSYIINVFSCFAITILCVNFMLSLNEKAEFLLDNMAQEVKIKNGNLQKTNEELDRFLYSTSHDLRAPLLSVKGLINLSLREKNREVVDSYLAKMNNRVDWLDAFIKEIIDYSRNARSDVKNDKILLREMIEEAVDGLRFLDGANNIRFELKLSVDFIVSDRRRLEIVINNLLANAIKYHDLRKQDQWIRVTTKEFHNGWILEIADNGQGIDEQYQAKVFDMFFRGTENSKGSGLGLFIVKETADKLNGNISLNSVKGIGSVFTLRFKYTDRNIIGAIQKIESELATQAEQG